MTGLNEESREIENSERNRAHINAKKNKVRYKNQDGNINRRQCCALRRYKNKKEKKNCENGKRCDEIMQSSCSLPGCKTEATTNDSSFSKELLIIHEVAR